MYKLVLIRHGESVWNKSHKFTGWTDVDLTDKGIQEAKDAAKLLTEGRYKFDLAFCSVLIRAKRTLEIILKEMGIENLPTEFHWRLNERHYGALQGFNKKEMAAEKGEEQVYIWRRSYNVSPPKLEESDKRHPIHSDLYKDVNKSLLPASECLKDTVKRVMPYWKEKIAPAIKSNKKLIISAHGNSLRALVKYLDNISDEDIPTLNIPTGIPLVYELDENLKPIKSYYLGDQDKLKKAMDKVANQGKIKKHV